MYKPSPVKKSANFLMKTCSSSVASSYSPARSASNLITIDNWKVTIGTSTKTREKSLEHPAEFNMKCVTTRRYRGNEQSPEATNLLHKQSASLRCSDDDDDEHMSA